VGEENGGEQVVEPGARAEGTLKSRGWRRSYKDTQCAWSQVISETGHRRVCFLGPWLVATE